eukprot:4622994-Pleurochrysis_carterae.AAC.1
MLSRRAARSTRRARRPARSRAIEMAATCYISDYMAYYTSDPCYTKWQLVAIFTLFGRGMHKLQIKLCDYKYVL